MTDQTLRRADELLTELIELVETARAVPMSASCVLPREQVLDLLDDLRDVLPPEIEEARRLTRQRDTVLIEAGDQRARIIEQAQIKARELLDATQAQQDSLVAATAVHQAAAEASEQLRHEAEDYARAVRTEADNYAATLRSDASAYAERTLADLVGVLNQAAATTERGRQALRRDPTPAS